MSGRSPSSTNLPPPLQMISESISEGFDEYQLDPFDLSSGKNWNRMSERVHNSQNETEVFRSPIVLNMGAELITEEDPDMSILKMLNSKKTAAPNSGGDKGGGKSSGGINKGKGKA